MNNINFRIDSFNRTEQGFLAVKARATRVGVLDYTDNTGKLIREFRPADEVFKEDSINTLKNAPVTIGHPLDFVNPMNVKQLEVGHSTETVNKTDEWIDINLIIKDPIAIDRVEKKDLTELSAGYKVDSIEEQSGYYKNERYDRIQRGIKYNHIALLQKGRARAGSDAKILRIDSTNDLLRFDSYEEEKVTMAKIRIDSTEVEVPNDLVAILESKFSKDKARIDSLEADLTAKDEKINELSLEQEKIKGRLDAKDSEPKANDLLKQKLAIFSKVNKVIKLDVSRLDSLSDEQMIKDAILAKNPKAQLDNLDAKQLEARLDGMIEALEISPSYAGSEKISEGFVGDKGQARNDSYDPRAEMIKNNQEIYKNARKGV